MNTQECCRLCPRKFEEGAGKTHCTNKIDCPCHTPETTPDTEWEKTAKWWYSISEEGLSLEMLHEYIKERLSSRDTHWKERVLEATSDVMPPAGEMGDYPRGVIEGACYVKRIVLEALEITNEDNLK